MTPQTILPDDQYDMILNLFVSIWHLVERLKILNVEAVVEVWYVTLKPDRCCYIVNATGEYKSLSRSYKILSAGKLTYVEVPAVRRHRMWGSPATPQS